MSNLTRIVTKNDDEGIQVEYVLPTDLYDKIVNKVNSYMDKYVGWRRMFVFPGEQAEDNIMEGKYGYIINAISAQSNIRLNRNFTENLPRIDALVVNYNTECLLNHNSVTDSNGLTNGRTKDVSWSTPPTVSTSNNIAKISIGSSTVFKINDFSFNLDYGYTIQFTMFYNKYSGTLTGLDNKVYLELNETETLKDNVNAEQQNFMVKLGSAVSYSSGTGTDYKYQVSIKNFGGQEVIVPDMITRQSKLDVILSVSGEKALLYCNGTKLNETTNISNLRSLKTIVFNRNLGNSSDLDLNCIRVWNTALDELDIESVYELNEQY